MSRRPLSLLLPALVSALLAAGCGAACDDDNLCAVEGHPPEVGVCNGSEFRSCGDSNRGEAIPCVRTSRRAVCTPSGWSFEGTAPGAAN